MAPPQDIFGLGAHYRFDQDAGVWRRDLAPPFFYSDGEEAEAYLLEIVGRASDRSSGSDELAARIRDWPSEYHLSPLRANLLRGLRLHARQKILEVGAGCGALSRYLGERGARVLALEGSERRSAIAARRCRDLPNVQVCNDDFRRFTPPVKFDLVLLIGVLEYAPTFLGSEHPEIECLSRARACLADGGCVVIAIENRFGLKYFGGASEDHTNRRFDSLADLYSPGSCRTYGYRELTDALRAAGFEHVEFLFPFPDYKLPRALVRGTALEHSGLDVGVLVSQYRARDYAKQRVDLFCEPLVWPLVVRNGLLPHLSNSFLVIAGQDPGSLLGDWLVKTFSAERRRVYRTENTFVNKASGIDVHKHYDASASAVDGPLQMRGGFVERYVRGALYNMQLHRMVFSPDPYRQYVTYLKRYFGFLHSQAGLGEVAWDARVGGGYYDCIPCNLVVDGSGELHAIDQEWVFEGGMPFYYLGFRAVVHDLARLHCLGSYALFAEAQTVAEFVCSALNDAGVAISRREMQWCVEMENRVLEQLLVRSDPGNIIYRLGRRPEEAFAVVADLDQHVGAAPRPALSEALARCRADKAAIESSWSFRVGRGIVQVVGLPVRACRRLRSK